jgi:hypothetical protein
VAAPFSRLLQKDWALMQPVLRNSRLPENAKDGSSAWSCSLSLRLGDARYAIGYYPTLARYSATNHPRRCANPSTRTNVLNFPIIYLAAKNPTMSNTAQTQFRFGG